MMNEFISQKFMPKSKRNFLLIHGLAINLGILLIQNCITFLEVKMICTILFVHVISDFNMWGAFRTPWAKGGPQTIILKLYYTNN